MDTPCSYCGQPMQNRVRTRAKFCSPACKDKARTAARRLAILSERPVRLCATCQTPLALARKGNALCCSRRCSWRYQNKVHAAARKAERRSRRQPCGQCGGPIGIDRRAGVIYCSPACKKQRMATRWRAKAPGYMRQYLYGLTPEQYTTLLEAQDGLCAICRTDKPGGKGSWHVDHDHATKKVRGLLCTACNTMLGHAKDDLARLETALAYLR